MGPHRASPEVCPARPSRPRGEGWQRIPLWGPLPPVREGPSRIGEVSPPDARLRAATPARLGLLAQHGGARARRDATRRARSSPEGAPELPRGPPAGPTHPSPKGAGGGGEKGWPLTSTQAVLFRSCGTGRPDHGARAPDTVRRAAPKHADWARICLSNPDHAVLALHRSTRTGPERATLILPVLCVCTWACGLGLRRHAGCDPRLL